MPHTHTHPPQPLSLRPQLESPSTAQKDPAWRTNLIMPNLCLKSPTVLCPLLNKTYLSKDFLLAWMSFPGSTAVKNLPANAGDTRDTSSIPELGRSSGEGNGNPSQYLAWKKSHGHRSLEGYSSWGLKASEKTEWLNNNKTQHRHILQHNPLSSLPAPAPSLPSSGIFLGLPHTCLTLVLCVNISPSFYY